MGNWRSVVTVATVLVSMIFTVNASLHPDVNSRMAAMAWVMVMLFWWGWDMSMDIKANRRLIQEQARELIKHRQLIESLCADALENQRTHTRTRTYT